ncbi:Hybrid signal transduction histidine kinase K [Seminavis robusta]|uniref:Hybrid signal transduction histidine kinase K n=1 Tax=Seminavis robusta TaxID=568900 RepID=A0A9N8EQD4_9STRA|nr:Hybrid signal transduction histidine kinase K [Seminavis robusta]|eukprot:Sro1404_g269710.1 Hybrid signal transduction histidine kinase K (1292) ;mRNA; r:9319-13362
MRPRTDRIPNTNAVDTDEEMGPIETERAFANTRQLVEGPFDRSPAPEESASGACTTCVRECSREGCDTRAKRLGDSSHAYSSTFGYRSACIIATLVLAVGAGASSLILGAGYHASQQSQESQYQRLGADLIHLFEMAIKEHLVAGLWIHQACRQRRDSLTHQEFRVVYESLASTGLDLQAIGWAMNVTGAQERAQVESHTRQFLQEEYPEFNYTGFRGFDPTRDENPATLHHDRTHYYPVHFVEPLEDLTVKAALLDFDISTSLVRRNAVLEAVNTKLPAMTSRMKGLQNIDSVSYSTMIMHPGVSLSDSTPESARRHVGDVSIVVIRIQEMIMKIRRQFNVAQPVSVFLYDSTEDLGIAQKSSSSVPEAPAFLGGAQFHADQGFDFDSHHHEDHDGSNLLTFSTEQGLEDVRASSHRYRFEKTMSVASRRWTFVAVFHDCTLPPTLPFLGLGASLIFLASLFLAFGMVSNHRRTTNIHQLKAQASAERANRMIEQEKQSTERQRELNQFVSHEIRSPIAAGISSCSFVQSALQDCRNNSCVNREESNQAEGSAKVLIEEAELQCIEEDVAVIDQSLQFVNDLLRNILDLHRASCNQMQIEMEPVNLLQDVLEPVASILHQRHIPDFEVLVECEDNLILLTDKLRLKQTVLNLGRNSTKFVTTGFVRLGAAVVNGNVQVYVEDSGPGIPQEKREHLFGRFQDALDALGQGTGLGLSLCKKLVELMGGQLGLDESYDSGVPGCPGARFVVDLATEPIEEYELFSSLEEDGDSVTPLPTLQELQQVMPARDRRLPENMTVLLVDDDWRLRTLFSKALSRVTEGWTIREAANGETALRLVEETKFDLVFMDQYMSCVVKQLLGTETVHAMRARGVSSIICGLSSNDVEKSFLQAGADCFLSKPLPTEQESLTDTLFHVLDSAPVKEGPASQKKAKRPSFTSRKFLRSDSGICTLLDDISESDESVAAVYALPKALRVMFVEPDMEVFESYRSCIRQIAPCWTCHHVSDGKTAIDVVAEHDQHWDLIFLDQMGCDKQNGLLLGTDIVTAMRELGVESVVCGLSTNQSARKDFLDAGATCFRTKPLFTTPEDFALELLSILGIPPSEATQGTPARLPPTNPTAARANSPLGQPATRNSALVSSSSQLLPPNLSVLLVDDSPMLRKMFSRCFQRVTHGWTIHEASTGEDALSVLESRAVDIVFLDQHTNSSMLGTDVATAIREQYGAAITICGLSGDDIEFDFLDAGADCFVRKPFPCDPDNLTKMLSRVVNSRGREEHTSQPLLPPNRNGVAAEMA